jgi:cathepsin L
MGSATPPASLDYNALGKVTSIKNQGSCGCCWAFSSVATYESWLLIKGFNLGVSEEGVLECTYLYSEGRRQSNCTVGYLTDAMDYLAKVGGVLRSNYPYVSGSISSGAPATTPGICAERNRIYIGNGTSTYDETLTTAQIKQKLTDNGPLMVGLYADHGFSAYSSGVYSGCPANASLYINHAVELIGYDSSGNWLIKNQWGTDWGVNGFMTLSSSRDCGLSKAIIGMEFTTLSANPSVNFDPTVFQIPVAGGEDTYDMYEVGILAILVIIL